MPVAPPAPPDLFHRTIGGNTAALLIGRALGAVAGLVVALVAARALGPDFGRFAALAAVGAVANTLVTFGTDTVVTRAVARAGPDRPSADTVGSALRFQLAAASALVAAAVMSVAVFGAPWELLIPAVSLWPQAVQSVAAAILRGRQNMGRLVVAGIGGAVVAVAVVIVADQLDRLTVASALTATALGALVSAAGAAAASGGLVPEGWRADGVGVGALTGETAVFAAMVVATALATQGPLIAVDAAGLAGAAGFGVALRLLDAARWLPASAHGALFPALAAGGAADRRYRRSVRLVDVAVLAVTVLLIVAAAPLAERLFGDPALGTTLIRILALALPLMAVRLRMSSELIAAGAERAVLVSALVGLVVAALGTFGGLHHANTLIVAWAQVAGVAANAAVLAVFASERGQNGSDGGS